MNSEYECYTRTITLPHISHNCIVDTHMNIISQKSTTFHQAINIADFTPCDNNNYQKFCNCYLPFVVAVVGRNDD